MASIEAPVAGRRFFPLCWLRCTFMGLFGMSVVKRALRKILPESVKRKLKGTEQISASAQTFADGGVVLIDKFLDPQQFIKVQQWAVNAVCDRTREARKWEQGLILDFDESSGSRQWSTEHDDMPPELKIFVDAVRATGFIGPTAEIHIGVYRWHARSGMGEHFDAHTNTAITFYLNDTWKDNWFGDFIFYESNEHKVKGMGHAVAPLANRVVINRDTVSHKVTYTSNMAVDRITLQAFLPKPKPKD